MKITHRALLLFRVGSRKDTHFPPFELLFTGDHHGYAPRAVWKGYLRLGAVSCGVKLVGATSEAGKIHFRILNRKDRQPVKSAYVHESAGDTVETEDQVKL